MKARIEELLNDISMALLLSENGGDKSGLPTEILAILQELSVLTEKAADYSWLAEAGAHFIKTGESADLQSFVGAAQLHLAAPESNPLPDWKKEAQVKEEQLEVVEDIDPSLLVEFIEKHSTMLEDFESSIVNFRYSREEKGAEGLSEDEVTAFNRFVKGYVHNIKGDAGSIGLMGVERACHYSEDLMIEQLPASILDALMVFKEWLLTYIRALSQGEPIPELSESFMGRFKSMCEEAKQSSKPAVPSILDGLPAEANLDLIAELMGGLPDQVQNAQALDSEPDVEEAAGCYQMTGDAEVFFEFAVEAEEHLTNVESTLLQKDELPGEESVASIFRAIHSIKGASAFYNLKDISETSHLTENLLDEVRKGQRNFDKGLVELVLNWVTLQQGLLAEAREGVVQGGTLKHSPKASEYISRLKEYQGGGSPQKGITAAQAAQEFAAREAAASFKSKAAEPSEPGSERKSQAVSDKLEVKNFVKVEATRLDQLIDSIGEMCIYSSMLISNCRQFLTDNEHVIKITHQVEKFSRDLQNIGMSMRLIPIRGLFQKMSRLVWDISKKIGKEVKFSMDGEDTEIDRIIVDKLADPLMHMIRNAIDHGIESPEERIARGKPAVGCIELSAYHAGGSIHIRIQDDGRGLDPDKLLKKALEKGIVGEGQRLSDKEIYNLIFAAGFSTAQVVTDLSGRGVGMDVVKRNIDSLRGRVHIDSKLGQGTTFIIELPLTLAVIDGICVGLGRESYIIPTISIVEFAKADSDCYSRTLNRGETFHFRGKYLPVFRLGSLFDVQGYREDPLQSIFVVMEGGGGEQFVIMVDQLFGTISTVIKNLGEMFEHRRGVAGGAIMANGDVALILDPGSLLHMARERYSFALVADGDVGTGTQEQRFEGQ